MSDEPTPSREINFNRLFPWLRLFRSIGVSIDPKKLFLAALGLIALTSGWGVLDRVFSGTSSRFQSNLSAITLATDIPWGIPDFWLGTWRLSEPVRCLVGPFLTVFSLQANGATYCHAFLTAVWAVIVWGIFGGSIARVATVQVACGHRIGVKDALRFALGKSIPLICGPLSPLIGIVLLTLPCLVFGLLFRLPLSFGPVITSALLVFPLLAGLVMTLILVGLATGWPLMHASVAAEAEDGFDALSRSYAYVFQRPIRYGAYLILALIIGQVGLNFVLIFAQFTVHMAHWAVGFTAPQPPLDDLFHTFSQPVRETSTATGSFWLSVVKLLTHGWIYSYFWSAASLIYLTLRQDVDQTDWRQVSLPPAPPHPHSPEVEPVAAAD